MNLATIFRIQLESEDVMSNPGGSPSSQARTPPRSPFDRFKAL